MRSVRVALGGSVCAFAYLLFGSLCAVAGAAESSAVQPVVAAAAGALDGSDAGSAAGSAAHSVADSATDGPPEGAADSAALPSAEAPVAPQYRLSTLPTAYARLPALPGVATMGAGQEMLFSLPATFGFGLLSRGTLDDLSSPLDRPRATYRYTWFSHPSWDVKVGLSTTVDNSSMWQRFFLAGTDHLRAGGLPSMHIASEGHLSDRWLWSVSAEGLLTGRGQGVDMDLRVDYSLGRDVALFGSYRLTDSTGEVPELFGFVPANSARLGVRLRF